MTWEQRIREAAYTSPGGTRLTFQYENVRQEVDKKTTAFDFPDADGTFVQDLGHTGRRYPLRLFFWGADYDQEVEAFEAALLERGAGTLEHPIYGVKNVVPFGSITRRDDLKTAANQAVLEVAFWETLDLVYPTPQGDPSSAVFGAIDSYNNAAAGSFAETSGLTTATATAKFRNGYQRLQQATDRVLGPIAATQEDVQKQFTAINQSINDSLTLLIAEPLTLAFQTTQLIQSPARALTGIKARLNAYGDLAQSIIGGDGAVVSPTEDRREAATRFHTNDLYASTYVTGSVLSAVNNQFETKAEAVAAAEVIVAQFEEVAAWRDENFQVLDEGVISATVATVDTGAAYKELLDAVAAVTAFLVEISFTLPQERRLVLDRDRTVIDVVAELYGELDERFDFFINSNDLTGSEILELPRGREIVFYV